jgi:hypothetical protein
MIKPCLLVGHDGGYVPTIESVITDGYKSKLVLLTGYKEVQTSIKRLDLPMLDIAELFEKHKLGATNGPTPGLGFKFASVASAVPSLAPSPKPSPRKRNLSPPTVLVESDSESIVSMAPRHKSPSPPSHQSNVLRLKPGVVKTFFLPSVLTC